MTDGENEKNETVALDTIAALSTRSMTALRALVVTEKDPRNQGYRADGCISWGGEAQNDFDSLLHLYTHVCIPTSRR